MVDNSAVAIDEFGFLRTADGARILCNPSSTYYSGPSISLPIRNYNNRSCSGISAAGERQRASKLEDLEEK